MGSRFLRGDVVDEGKAPTITSQKSITISINFQVTITFLAICLVDAARLSSDSYWLASNYNIFFEMAA